MNKQSMTYGYPPKKKHKKHKNNFYRFVVIYFAAHNKQYLCAG